MKHMKALVQLIDGYLRDASISKAMLNGRMGERKTMHRGGGNWVRIEEIALAMLIVDAT